MLPNEPGEKEREDARKAYEKDRMIREERGREKARKRHEHDGHHMARKRKDAKQEAKKGALNEQ